MLPSKERAEEELRIAQELNPGPWTKRKDNIAVAAAVETAGEQVIDKETIMENTGKLRNMASIYLSCEDKMLLLFRQGSRVVNDLWVGSAGGHFEAEEYNDAKACVLRELEEELSVTEDMLDNLALRYITMRRTKGEIRVNYYFFAELKGGTGMNLKSNEGTLKWFQVEELKELQMPFSAKYVVEHYLREGRNNNMIYGGIGDGEKVVFTEMPEF